MTTEKQLSEENERRRANQRLRPTAHWLMLRGPAGEPPLPAVHAMPNRKERAEGKARAIREGKTAKEIAAIEGQPRSFSLVNTTRDRRPRKQRKADKRAARAESPR